MSNEEANFRRLVIKNYRNLAPFCAGTEEDDNKDKEFLTLNRSLNREELGCIVTLIGVNNSGKSNVLDALEAYGKGSTSRDDCTDFLYSDPIEPSITMNIANGRYGDAIRTKRKEEKIENNVITGPFHKVLFCIMMEEESYKLAQEYANRPLEPGWNMDFRDPRTAPLKMNRACNLQEWKKIGYDHVYTDGRRSEVVSYVLKKRGLTLLNKSPLDEYYFNHIKKREYGQANPDMSDPVISVISEGTPIDCSDDERASRILKEIGRPTGDNGIEAEDEETARIKQEEFEKTFGYVITNEVIRYERNKISRSALSCSPSRLNPVILTLLNIIGYNEGSIKNAYANHTLRSRLEKKINESLNSLSEEFNELMNIDEKRYSFEMRLEKDNIELIMTYGDDVPLNIDKQSEGFRWLFDFYINFLLKENLRPGCIVLMDEFGNSLGFSTVKELVKKLRKFAQSNGITFVLATQNPMAVDVLHLDEVRLVVPMEDGSSHIVNNFDQFGEAGSHDIMDPVINGLMVSRNYMRTEGRRTVFVEGATDYFYLNAFSESMRCCGKEVDLDFVPMNGLGSREDAPTKILSQIRAIERSPTIFVDGDKAGEKFVAVATSKGVKPSSVSEIFEDGKKEIEDLFSKKDAERFCVKDKSFDKAACFSHRLRLIYDEIDEETKKNFETVIDYIMAQ